MTRQVERVSRRPIRCSNPAAYIWCQGQVAAGARFVVVIEGDGTSTGRAVGFLCPACADHQAAR